MAGGGFAACGGGWGGGDGVGSGGGDCFNVDVNEEIQGEPSGVSVDSRFHLVDLCTQHQRWEGHSQHPILASAFHLCPLHLL